MNIFLYVPTKIKQKAPPPPFFFQLASVVRKLILNRTNVMSFMHLVECIWEDPVIQNV